MSVCWTMEVATTTVSTLMEATTAPVTLAMICNKTSSPVKVQVYEYVSLEVNVYLTPEINECALDNGGCQHNCINTDGSYYCSCDTGYDLQQDKLSCQGIIVNWEFSLSKYFHIGLLA